MLGSWRIDKSGNTRDLENTQRLSSNGSVQLTNTTLLDTWACFGERPEGVRSNSPGVFPLVSSIHDSARSPADHSGVDGDAGAGGVSAADDSSGPNHGTRGHFETSLCAW